MDDASERMRILELIETGQISADEGLRQLAALQEEVTRAEAEAASLPAGAPGPALSSGESSSAQEAGGNAPETATSEPVQPEIISESLKADFERWKGYWLIPLWVGVGITILGGMLMYWALQSSGIGFWFLCAALPFALGVIILSLGAYSRSARWLHVRVQQAPGERPQRIAISFPIPIGLLVWFMQTFRHRLPGMENVPANIDEILYTLRDSTSPENPIHIHVDEDEDGEKVEVYIG